MRSIENSERIIQRTSRRHVTLKIYNFAYIPCHKKIQPIRIQISRCIFDGIISNLPIMRRAYIALIAYFLWHRRVLIGQENKSDRGIYHGIALESVA